MSKERDLKRLRKSLHETQDILNHLIKETSEDLEKKWGTTRGDAEKRLKEAGKRFEKRYEETRSNLETTLKTASKDFEKKYPQQKKEAEKAIAKLGDSAFYTNAMHNYKDASTEARKKYEELRSNATVKTQDLRLRTADLLQGLAAGVLTLRNRLEPKKRLALRNEKEKHHLGRGGYFKRFIALAVIIVSKKDRLLSLGQEAYHKLQDAEARQSLKDDALGQYDTMRRLIKAYANGHYKEFPYTSIVKIVAAIVYFVSVVDLIPDFIPILGLTDDLAVLAWVYTSVKDDLQQFVDWEEANERRREKMESQKASGKTTTAADREAANPTAATPTVRSTTTPATSPASTSGGAGAATGGTSSANNSGNTNSANKTTGSGSNTGSGSGNASSTSGSANSGNTGGSASSGSGGSGSNQKSGGSTGSNRS